MLYRFLLAGAIAGICISAPASAALPNGTKAPDFTLQATLGGNVFTFSLADALKKGPVVLYFYPAAFTKGCTIEAHDFADAIDQYKALNATVIGVSHDPGRQTAICRPYLVRDRAKRHDRLQLHIARSQRTCQQHAHGTQDPREQALSAAIA